MRGARRAREGHDILTAQMIEEVTHRAADQLERAVGKNSRVQHASEDLLGQIGGDGSGLDDDGDPRQESRCELLQHSPDGKVERVDVHGRAFQRNADVLSDEGCALGEGLDGTVDEHPLVGKLAHPLAGIDEQSADPAVDVDPGIAARRARRIGQAVEVLLVLGEHLRQRLQQSGALVERELAQSRSAHSARMVQHGGEIEPVRRCAEDDLSGRGIPQIRQIAAAALPLARRITL